MRYLWIEDFDGGKSGRTEIKRELERYFQLTDSNINFCTLEKTLEFLDIASNWNLFDAILIDIRFKVCEKEQDEVNIYNKYFSSFLTKDKYDSYTYKINGDANTASSGVLLYLALIHRYNYNQKRIAFVSANVDETSDKLTDINNMREYIAKAKYAQLLESDKEDFSMLNESVFDLYVSKINISIEEAEENFPIPEKDSIDWEKLNELESHVDDVENQIKTIFRQNNKVNDTELKYNSVKEEFKKVGLKLPIAFPKPGGSFQSDISWKFKQWVEEVLNDDYYKLRSSILPICMDIKNSMSDSEKQLKMPYRRLLGNYNNNAEEVEHMLSEIIDLFPGNIWTENNSSLYIRIVRECVSLCDGLRPQKGVVDDVVAAESVLKIVRNWMSHQGIKNIGAYDVAFIFYTLIVAFFADDIKKNICVNAARELILDFDANSHELKKIDIDKEISKAEDIARNRHKESYERFKNKVGQQKAESKKNTYSYNENASIYDTVSAIGNQYSDIRENVCMEYVYLLYLETLNISKNKQISDSLVRRMIENDIFKGNKL